MNQEQFSKSTIINIERDIIVNIEIDLNTLAKKKLQRKSKKYLPVAYTKSKLLAEKMLNLEIGAIFLIEKCLQAG